jgi:hypothetical protein
MCRTSRAKQPLLLKLTVRWCCRPTVVHVTDLVWALGKKDGAEELNGEGVGRIDATPGDEACGLNGVRRR